MTNAKLREYVTSTAFNLSLSKTHITALAAVYHGNGGMAYDMALWVTALRGLERRGLVIWHGDDPAPKGFVWERLSGYTSKDAAYRGSLSFSERYEMTRAGELAALLLIEADLIPAKLTKDGVKKRVSM